MKRILILTAGYGEGHNAAARGLASGLDHCGANAEVRDLFAETYGRRHRMTQRLYIECINRAAPVWAMAYRALDRTPLMALIIATLGAVRRGLAKLIEEQKPDAVVSVYPVYGWLWDRLYPPGAVPCPFHTVVTDSITVNKVWLRYRSDSWIVPNKPTADVLCKLGVPAGRVHALGFPVPTRFADANIVRVPPGNGEPLRVFQMVNHGRPATLRLVRRLLDIPGVRLTVTTGKDEVFGRTLSRLARESGKQTEVHGWTPLIPELLMKNHVLISKAGGAATQEAIAAKTPMVITQAVPGQEEGNARLIVENDCGAFCETNDAIVDTISRLTENQCRLWHRWHSAISSLSRPDASREIARFILSFPITPNK